MYYIMRLSGGTASAVACEMAIARYGRNKVIIRFEDVSWEDADNYRFIADCMQRWGGKLSTQKSGRTPLDVFEAKHLIPNSGMAPCSYELKMKPFEDWLWRMPKPVTILSGLSWHEPQRIEKILHYHRHRDAWRAPMGFARRIPGVYEDFPLATWTPVETRSYNEIVRSWGIEPPALYKAGMPHSNCGGRCVRQGISEWKRLWTAYPDRFGEMRDWEQAQRAKGGARAKAAFCRSRVGGGPGTPITLLELEQKWVAERGPMLDMFEFEDDMGSCFCTDDPPE